MEFTTNYEGYITRNPIRVVDRLLYVQCADGVFLTDVKHLPTIAAYRWRIVNESILTTMVQEDRRELPIRIENVLLRKHRSIIIKHKNNNPFDVRVSNLVMERTHTNIIRKYRDYARLKVDRQYVLIDREDIPVIEQYHWNIYNPGGKTLQVRTYLPALKGRRTLVLSKLVLKLDHLDRVVVWFKNGNRLDCRKANLQVKDNGRSKSQSR